MADIITLEEYKAYKDIGKTDKDAKITFLIASVSTLIKTYCRQTIVDNWSTPIVETIHTPYDSTTIYLNAFPVKEIIAVDEIFGGYVGGLDSTVHYPMVFDKDFQFREGTSSLSRLGSNWSRDVQVTYTAGYETAPADLKLAAIELVSYYLNEEWKPGRSMQGTSIAGPVAEPKGIPIHIEKILNNYRVLV